MEIIMAVILTLMVVGLIIACIIINKAYNAIINIEKTMVEVCNAYGHASMIINDAKEVIEYKKEKLGLNREEIYED